MQRESSQADIFSWSTPALMYLILSSRIGWWIFMWFLWSLGFSLLGLLCSGFGPNLITDLGTTVFLANIWLLSWIWDLTAMLLRGIGHLFTAIFVYKS